MTYEDLCRRSAEDHINAVGRVLPSIRAEAPRVLAGALQERPETHCAIEAPSMLVTSSCGWGL
jgi:hypothetical protein